MNSLLSFFKKLRKYENQIETPDLKTIHKFVLVPKDFYKENYKDIDILNDQIISQNNISYDEKNFKIIACHKTESGKLIIYDNIDSEYYLNLIEIFNSESDTNY